MSEETYIVRTHQVRETPDFCFEIEEFNNGFCMAHIAVHRWGPSVLKQMLKDWRLLRSRFITCPLYATAPLQDEKWQRFVSLFGFKPDRPVVTNSGETRMLYRNIQ